MHNAPKPGLRHAKDQDSSRRLHVILTLFVGAAAGLVAFFSLGFSSIFPPSDVTWILHYTNAQRLNDSAMMFVGWDFFRHSPWQFPLGLNKNYGLELGSSIVYSDSIPLLAFPFKLLSPVLPAQFQFFGIWILLCLTLQGAFAARLASRITNSLTSQLLIALFFVFSPILLEQGREQFSLMAQWLILWSIDLYLTESQGRIRWRWPLLAALAAMTSFYFEPMVLLIWSAEATKSLARRTVSPLRIVAEGASITTALLLTTVTCGFFAIPIASAQSNGFGTYGVNLLGLIDPWGKSLFLQRQPNSPLWQAEGYAYLGLGMLLICIIALYQFARRPVSKRVLLYLTPLALVMAGMALFALSNQIAFGSHVILNLGNFWGFLGPIFRGSGRLFWPAYYGIWLGGFWLLLRGLRPRTASIILALMLTIQLIDYSPACADLLRRNVIAKPWRSPLQSNFWPIAAGTYRQIISVPSGTEIPVYPIAFWCAENNLGTNIVHVNRQPGPALTDAINAARLADLRADHPDRQCIYVIPDSRLFSELARTLTKEHGIGRIDGYNVIAPFWFARNGPGVRTGLIPAGG